MSCCDLFIQLIVSLLIRGIQSYGPETTLYTYPPNVTLLTSSEENKVYFKELEDAVHKFTLPGKVEQILANHTALNTEGWQERMGYVKEFIRNRNKKYYNNQTGLFETYQQRMAKIHEGMMDEMFEEAKKDKDFRKERYMNAELVERFLAQHPNVSFIPEMHAVTDYDFEYSGDRIIDDYEVKRRKREVDETEKHVSNNNNKMANRNTNVKNMVRRDTCKTKVNTGALVVSENESNNKNQYRAKKDLFKTGIIKHEKNVICKRKYKRKREVGNQHFTTKEDLLKSLKYLALRNKLFESVEEKHVVKRSAHDRSDDVPARKKELYKDYKSDWPYSKYDSNIHADYIVPIPRRKKNSSNYKKLYTPESSIFNSFYNDGENERDTERVKKKNLYRSMEYWTFTDPMAKYTSTPTIKYDKPYPTFGRNAATISVGASRFKLFNRNWYNEYKHRVHKRDVLGNNSTAVNMLHKVGNYISKAVLVYNTLMTFYFKSIYRYLRNMYYQSYFSNNHFNQNVMLLDDDDPEYMAAVNRIANWSHYSFTTLNPNLTYTILSEGNESLTQYIMLNWYTEKYKDNSTQYFCDYLNDTYILVNKRLKLYNKTLHQVIPDTDLNQNGSFETDYPMFDMRTLRPPELSMLSSDEREKLLLNLSSTENDKYLVIKNMSNPSDNYQAPLNEITGQNKMNNLYPNEDNTDKNNTKNLNQQSRKEVFDKIKTQYGVVTDYQDDLFDKAADFILSFFNLNNTRKNALNTETTTDDYTEMTNDLFDKIGNAAVGFFEMCNNVSSTSLEETSDVIPFTESTAFDNKSERFRKTETLASFTSKDLFKNYIPENKTEVKELTVNIQVNNSLNPIPKRKIPSNVFPMNSKKIRSKRSLASRCLKGIKFVGHVFKPIEKHIVNVLNDIFGPYSSSYGNSDQPIIVKDKFKRDNIMGHSSDNGLHYHAHLSSSLEEEKSQTRDGSISGKSAIKKIESKLRDKSHGSKEKNLKIKSDSSLDSKGNSEVRITRKKSKRKHKKKHHNLDDAFMNSKSYVPYESHEKKNDKTLDDSTLPSFVRYPNFGDTNMDNAILDSHNAANTEDPMKISSSIKNSKKEDKPTSNQLFGDQLGNTKFPDYNYQQTLVKNNQQFENQIGNNTFQDYDQQNPYEKNQPIGNQMGNNRFQEYDQQNPYGKNQPIGNQIGNNTFQDYDQQYPYARNPFGNQIGNNTFQNYDQQNPYGRNQPFGNQMGNNTFHDYDQQNPYGRNQPFGNQIENNTFQDYDQQNPYRRNQPIGNQMVNNTFQDYDQQNPYGRNLPIGNQSENNTFQDYDQQNPYGRNQPFGNQMDNNKFQDYGQQNLNGRNQLFGNQIGNNTFQDYNDPYKNFPGRNQLPDYNDQPSPYMKNGLQPTNDTFPDYNNQQNLNDPGNPYSGNNFYNGTFTSNIQNYLFNQSNDLSPYGNNGDLNSPPLNGVNDFLKNEPVQNSINMPPSYTLGVGQNLNNNVNGAVQKNNIDLGNFANIGPQVQQQVSDAKGNAQNNNLQINSISKNPAGSPLQ